MNEMELLVAYKSFRKFRIFLEKPFLEMRTYNSQKRYKTFLKKKHMQNESFSKASQLNFF